MAKRRVEVVLAEMIEAMDGVEAATAGKSLAEFQQDWLLKMGVQRALEIISEASRHIPDELLSLSPEIPWKQIRGIGNILRHEYHKIADEIVWAVVTENLSPLKQAIVAIGGRVKGC